MPAKAGIHDSLCCDEGEVATTKAKTGWSDFRPHGLLGTVGVYGDLGRIVQYVAVTAFAGSVRSGIDDQLPHAVGCG
jgi:hypothetical protein